MTERPEIGVDVFFRNLFLQFEVRNPIVIQVDFKTAVPGNGDVRGRVNDFAFSGRRQSQLAHAGGRSEA
jgi:hypothetical protein